VFTEMIEMIEMISGNKPVVPEILGTTSGHQLTQNRQPAALTFQFAAICARDESALS